MATFQFTSPDGKQYKVTAPDGATQEQAFEMLQGQLTGSQQSEPTFSLFPQQQPKQEQSILDRYFPSEQTDRTRDIVTDVAKEGGTLGGAYAGMRAGAALPLPLPYKAAAGVVGGIAGATMGAVAGQEAVDFGYEGAGGLDFKKALDVAKEAAIEETIGFGIGKAMVKGYDAYKKVNPDFLHSGTQEANKKLKELQDIQNQLSVSGNGDASLTMNQVRNSMSDRVMGGVAASSVFTRGKLQDSFLAVENAVNSRLDEVIKSGYESGNRQEFVPQFLTSIEAAKTALTDMGRPLYARIDQVGLKPDLSDIKSKTADLIRKGGGRFEGVVDVVDKKTGEITQKVRGMSLPPRVDVSPVVMDYYQKINKIADDVSVAELDTFRKGLSHKIIELEATDPRSNDARMLRELRNNVIDTIGTAVKTADPQLKADFDDYMKMYKGTMRNLESNAVNRLVRNPEAASAVLMGGNKDFSLSNMVRAMKTLEATTKSTKTPYDFEKNFSTLRSNYLEKVIGSPESFSNVGAGRSLSAVDAFKERLKDPDQLATFNAMMKYSGSNGVTRDTVETLLRTADTAVNKPHGMFDLIMAGRTAQAAREVVTPSAWDTPVKLGANVLGVTGIPQVFAWLLTDKKRVDRYLKLDKALQENQTRGFVRSMLSAKVVDLLTEFEAEKSATYGEQGATQANPMFNQQQSTLQ
jgi:hypothetical protein